MNELIEIAIGNDAGVLTWWQMSVRAVVVFFAALMVSFIGSNRVFSKSSFPDIVFGIMYGSVLSRAITGSSPFLPTLAAALVLVLVHKGLAVVAFHLGAGFGHFTKGEHVKLIEEGNLQRQALRKHSITKDDLLEAVHRSGNKGNLSDVKSAYLERSGQISIRMKSGGRHKSNESP